MTTTPIYAAILALLFVVLSVRVIGARRGAGITLGDGGDMDLLRRQRAHGNFAEYVPMALLLMALAELQGTLSSVVHAMGAVLVFGRAIHALGVSREPEWIAMRVTGMASTFAVLVVGALLNLTGGGWPFD